MSEDFKKQIIPRYCQEFHTRNLTSTEIKAIKDVLLAYDVLQTEMKQNNTDPIPEPVFDVE